MNWEVPIMQSRTSCFDKTLYRKNLRRFWPITFCASLLLFLFEPVYLLSFVTNPGSHLLDLRYHLVRSLCEENHILWFLFSVACAMAVFSWLYNARSTGFTAALPLTRKSLFLTCYLSGLSILLTVLLFTGGVMLLIALICDLAVVDLIGLWLLEGFLDILGFYGFASLCAMLTGSLVIMPLCTLALELAAVVIEELVRYLMGAMLFGYVSAGSVLSYASPLWTLLSRSRFDLVYAENEAVTDYVFSGMGMVAVYGLLGLVFTLLALRLFQNRRMEAAGDTVAIGVLKPVFRWCMGVGCGLLLAVLIYEMTLQGRYVPCTGGYLLLILALLLIGGLLGWFGADMLIQKHFRVFSLHRKGALLLCALLLCFGLSLGFDVFGLEKRIPAREKFDSVEIYCDGERAELDEEESIEQVMKLHESIISHRSIHEQRATDRYKMVSLYYYRGGRAIESRCFFLDAGREAQSDRNSDLRFAERVLNLSESIQERKKLSLPVTENSIYHATVGQWEYYEPMKYGITPEMVEAAVQESYADIAAENDASAYYFGACRDYSGYDWQLTPREAYELYTECILPDMQEGTLGRVWLVRDEEYAKSIYNIRFEMNLNVPDSDGRFASTWFYTVPTVHSKRTNAWLADHGVVLETYWDYLGRMGGREDVLE